MRLVGVVILIIVILVSDYKVEQSSFTLIALFWLEIGRCLGRNWLNGNQAFIIQNLVVVSLQRLTASVPCKFQGVGLPTNFGQNAL